MPQRVRAVGDRHGQKAHKINKGTAMLIGVNLSQRASFHSHFTPHAIRLHAGEPQDRTGSP
ncbi:hypothetical protein [Nostoc favosum]|uniref:Transposase n=1 Tax=Nostoc favosum CHAB5714 TaxID=2780399 RepID=A0ABS8I7D8_9NOSO|nr:hypothetical protein [Nostoc favosum]MCC5599698.1 hypothetical protein [Nostoc favosum CHAB5714]